LVAVHFVRDENTADQEFTTTCCCLWAYFRFPVSHWSVWFFKKYLLAQVQTLGS